MGSTKTHHIKFIILILFLISSYRSNAQKLPSVQTISLHAPENLRIDGKATEWKNQFQAFNKSTQVFYSIANDTKSLYLVLQAKDPDIITKILIGGITFTVNASNNIGSTFTFPIYDGEQAPLYSLLKNKPGITNDTVKYNMQKDSFMHALNNQLTSHLKKIGITGVKEISDSTISIYNETGIKAISLFNNNIYYTYELAVPLTYLGLSVDKPIKFNYNVKLNGSAIKNGRVQLSPSGRFITVYNSAGKPINAIPALPQTMITSFPTDFSGEYILAK